MAGNRHSIRDIHFDGGHLCLDFINTVDWRGTGREREWINRYVDLVAWGERAQVITKTKSAALALAARRDHALSSAALNRARNLRGLIHRVMMKVATGDRPAGRDITAINAGLAATAPRQRLVRAGLGFAWTHGNADQGVDCLLSPILWAAADLLADGELNRVTLCADEECGWLFYDTSRNRRRRWCSMANCGNRAKAKRHYARHRLS